MNPRERHQIYGSNQECPTTLHNAVLGDYPVPVKMSAVSAMFPRRKNSRWGNIECVACPEGIRYAAAPRIAFRLPAEILSAVHSLLLCRTGSNIR